MGFSGAFRVSSVPLTPPERSLSWYSLVFLFTLSASPSPCLASPRLASPSHLTAVWSGFVSSSSPLCVRSFSSSSSSSCFISFSPSSSSSSLQPIHCTHFFFLFLSPSFFLSSLLILLPLFLDSLCLLAFPPPPPPPPPPLPPPPLVLFFLLPSVPPLGIFTSSRSSSHLTSSPHLLPHHCILNFSSPVSLPGHSNPFILPLPLLTPSCTSSLLLLLPPLASSYFFLLLLFLCRSLS